jgi:hypothetical protein
MSDVSGPAVHVASRTMCPVGPPVLRSKRDWKRGQWSVASGDLALGIYEDVAARDRHVVPLWRRD